MYVTVKEVMSQKHAHQSCARWDLPNLDRWSPSHRALLLLLLKGLRRQITLGPASKTGRVRSDSRHFKNFVRAERPAIASMCGLGLFWCVRQVVRDPWTQLV